MPTTPQDERLHPVEHASKHWSDSLYFNAWDPSAGLFLLTRIAILPNKPGATAGMLVWSDGMPAYMYSHNLEHVPSADWDHMEIGGLRYRMQQVLQTWLIELSDGENGCALTWDGFTSVFHYHDNRQPLPKAVAWGHYEQSCTVRGEFTLNGRHVRFDGIGQRDHSWGFRHWGGLKEWHWVTALFGTKRSFNLFHVFQPDGTVTVNGFVHIDGKDLAIVAADRRTQEDDARNPESCTIQLTLTDGRQVPISGRRIGTAIPVRPGDEGTVVHEVPMVFTSDGLEGHGIYEFLENETGH